MNESDKRSLEVVGVDVARGLSYCLGDEALYRRILLCFLESHNADISITEKLLSEGRDSDLVRLVHRIKSGCAAIGAINIYSLALDIENRIPEEDGFGEALCQVMEKLEAVLKVIERISVNRMPSDGVLEDLIESIEKSSPCTARIYESLSLSQLKRVPSRNHGALRRAIYNFDFTLALSLLKDEGVHGE